MKQIPGKSHVFIRKKTGEKHKVILPMRYGESNDEVKWYSSSAYRVGGTWQSRKFCNQSSAEKRKGVGPSGLYGRMVQLKCASKIDSKKKGYVPINNTAEEMVKQWTEQKCVCKACKLGKKLTLLNRGSAYDHNHKSGKGRGFVHSMCNITESHLRRMGKEAAENLFNYVFGENHAFRKIVSE